MEYQSNEAGIKNERTMKKQNTLKPKDISYEPIIEEKKPYYLHSVERYQTGTPIWHYIVMAIIVLIIFSLAIILG